ncbi:conserved protein, unknown function [Hepatocystis sp. ex Piliocolobus tephrosceles]|nr:conserved protein, unknown function [Hepatocystis sp. ex Piliocolobus tephrosceles]
MNLKIHDMNVLTKDTILFKTKKLKKLCDNEGNINSKHLNTLIEILEYFFENYMECFLSPVVWEIVEKIILLENAIEEKKIIDVDFDTSILFCEFIFSKLIYYANYENDNFNYFFSFNCLKRHLCSIISSFLNFNNSSHRRKIEASFTNELTNLMKQIYEKIKVENDLELKVSYTEFLWRSFRRIDINTFNPKHFNVDMKTIKRLKKFKILKFDEECINWLKEENYIDKKRFIENGSFIIEANQNIVNREFLICYFGKCSVFIYYKSEEIEEDEIDEKCKIEIPYYHIMSIHFKSKTIFLMDCKGTVDQTNIFCLWGEDIKNSINYETTNMFSLSIEVKNCPKEIRKDLNKFLNTLNVQIKQTLNKDENNNEPEATNDKKSKIEKTETLSDFIDKTLNRELEDPMFSDNEQIMDNNISDKKLLKNNTQKGVVTVELEKRNKDKKRNGKKSKHLKSSQLTNHKKTCEDEASLKAITDKTHSQGVSEQDTDTDTMINKILCTQKEKKDKMKNFVKKAFHEALNEIDNNIKLLIEKQKNRRNELQIKYEKKKKNIVSMTEKEIIKLTNEMNALIESMKGINLDKNEIKTIYEEGKSIFCAKDMLSKSQVLIKKIQDNLKTMMTDINRKEKDYHKRKKLCLKALSTVYE